MQNSVFYRAFRNSRSLESNREQPLQNTVNVRDQIAHVTSPTSNSLNGPPVDIVTQQKPGKEFLSIPSHPLPSLVHVCLYVQASINYIHPHCGGLWLTFQSQDDKLFTLSSCLADCRNLCICGNLEVNRQLKLQLAFSRSVFFTEHTEAQTELKVMFKNFTCAIKLLNENTIE